jgi:hypothetical protein
VILLVKDYFGSRDRLTDGGPSASAPGLPHRSEIRVLD